MKKIVIIVGNAYSSDTRVNKEAQSLKKAGYDVVVYGINLGRKFKVEETIDGIKINRLNIDNYHPFRISGYKIFTQFKPALNRLIKEKANVYHCNDLDTLPIGYLAAKKLKAKLVYDSHELFSERVFDRKNFFVSALLGIKKPFWVVTESILASKANAVITINESIALELKKRYKIKEVIVVMNCPSKGLTKVTNSKKFHKLFGLSPDKKVILYQGNLTLIRGLRELVLAAKYFPKDFVLVLMGDGKIKPDLEKLVSDLQLVKKVRFLKPVPLKDLAYFTASADVGVIPYLNVCLNHYYCTPNKLFEYLGVGLPIAASDFPELKKVIKGENTGDLFDPSKPEEIAQTIKSILSDQKEYEETRRNALEVAREKYNWENEEKKLISLYRTMLGNN